jgi:DtxR family Mn-dependent transcriptional regulator
MPNPTIALLIAALVTAAGLVLLWPERGLLSRWRQVQRNSERTLIEDALKHIYKYQTKENCPTAESVAGALHITKDQAAELLAKMEARELLQRQGDSICLTFPGRQYALHIIRAHRLWERYLAEETGFSEAEWHNRADRLEHRVSVGEVDALSAQLGDPTHDPHGDPIPTAKGKMMAQAGQPLTAASPEEPLCIVHLEDEPEAVYAQLVAEGLHLGMQVRLLEVSAQRVRFWADGDEHVVAPIVASNISIVPLPEEAADEALPGERLSNLKPGEAGEVAGISHACRRPDRRRLMDLGILPGTLIEAEMNSPGGDPTAYRIRGALIALRREQAEFIHINQQQEARS